MLPFAPPTFSITTAWPSAGRIASPIRRAAASVEPPGGNGTTSVTGRFGKPCAAAAPANTHSASAMTGRIILPPPRKPESSLNAPHVEQFLTLQEIVEQARRNLPP